MQMRVVLAVGCPHRRDLLAARDPLAARDEHFLQVTIKRVDVFHVPALEIGVPHDNDVAQPR